MILLRSIIIIAGLAYSLSAQNAALQDDEDVQSWNDVQLSVPLSKRVDFFTRLTMRVGKNASKLSDGRHTLGIVWKPLSYLSISPFYSYIQARNSSGKFRIENRLNLSATYKFPVKKVGLSHRSTFERRLRPTRNTWRYRAMIAVEKPLPKTLVKDAKWFVSDEVFYDSVLEKFSRNRFTVGVSKTLSKKLALELYYTRQNDGFSHPGDLNIVGTAWKIKF